MERGSYSKLDQIDQIEIELNEHVPVVSLVEPSEQSDFDGAQNKRKITYLFMKSRRTLKSWVRRQPKRSESLNAGDIPLKDPSKISLG